MNAGAYGGEMKDVLVSARVMRQDGTVVTLTGEQLQLSYRHSIVQTENMIVLEAILSLEQGEKTEILERMRDLNRKRREKQPLEYGSAGSTFKRPQGCFAAKLIEDAGLKGYRVGDVMVSDKHSGFVVNVGNGTYRQAMQVIHHVQDTVRQKFQVELELEVKCLASPR
jgi:UDP-N-acetylmuramate dehydrogenase